MLTCYFPFPAVLQNELAEVIESIVQECNQRHAVPDSHLQVADKMKTVMIIIVMNCLQAFLACVEIKGSDLEKPNVNA